MMSVTDSLRDAVKRSEDSPYAISKSTGIAYPSLWNFMNGTSNLNGKTIDTLSAHFGMCLSYMEKAKTRKRK